MLRRTKVLAKGTYYQYFSAANCSTKRPPDLVRIGTVTKSISAAKNQELVPIGYFHKHNSQETLLQLQWIMKKDILGQDIFLIGLPGPLRRRIIFQYLELSQREVEYIVLSRDTTESDLKQRREITSRNATYRDQSAVNAAIEGRVLILDGVEKVERNVLPILNNLLENREVQLEDGRFLVSPERYEKLLSENSKEVLDEWKLVPVSKDFRVVALGLPIPQFRGHPLDPPFRSRFQSLDIRPSFEYQIANLSPLCPNLTTDEMEKILSLCHTFLTDEAAALNIPKFPVESLQAALQILDQVPSLPLSALFRWMFPYELLLPAEGRKYVNETLKSFALKNDDYTRKFDVYDNDLSNVNFSLFDFEVQGQNFQVSLPSHNCSESISSNRFIENSYHNNLLADMLLTHISSDFCLVGPKGCGKTLLVKQFASLLDYPTEMIMLYQDMTARDLLQQRVTDVDGNTIWRPSRLVSAALDGKLVMLDGLHRLHHSTLAILQRLIHDRELQLYDGTRLLRNDRYDALKTKYNFTDEDMQAKKILCIHPAFRIVALAEPPKSKNFKDQWMTPEILSMFLFHNVRPLSFEEEKHVIRETVGPLNEKIEVVLNFAHSLRTSKDEALVNISGSLSTRQLMRISQRLSAFPHQDINHLVSQSCLAQFLPQLMKHAMDKAFESAGIERETEKHLSDKVYQVKDGELSIGNTKIPVYEPGGSRVKVPHTLFYDNYEHLSVMEAMLQDFILGENLLLIGNQGVGKNKIVDRFLQLLNRPREYIQLHRDTTVQSLTQQPGVELGRIVYEDSPLVKAVQLGHVLVVDEADKAPTHVISILKAIVESGEMVLSDGRRILHHSDPRIDLEEEGQVVVMHPDFRMIVLANRPGFPFLGNDFFATLGDIFSCHAIENPSFESEISMLRRYGPNVPMHLLEKLVRLFNDLRSKSDEGIISYPYSTREIVNIVKHLERFPEEGLPIALKNVFDFDNYNKDLKDTLAKIFERHGITYGVRTSSLNLAIARRLPEPQRYTQWDFCRESVINPRSQQIKTDNPEKYPMSRHVLEVTEARSDTFSEQKKFWRLPLDENDVPLCVSAARQNNIDMIHVVCANSIALFSLNTYTNAVNVVDLSSAFPPVRRGFRPVMTMASLGPLMEDSVFVYEKSTNQMFLINSSTGNVTEISTSSIFAILSENFYKLLNKGTLDQKQLEMCSDLSHLNLLLFYGKAGRKITVLDLNQSRTLDYELPDEINVVTAVNDKKLLLFGDDCKFWVDITDMDQWKIVELKDYFKDSDPGSNVQAAASFKIADDVLCSSLKIDKNTPCILLASANDYASLVVGVPGSTDQSIVYRFPRLKALPSNADIVASVLRSSSQVVRVLSLNDIPYEDRKGDEKPFHCFLEVTDLNSQTYFYVPVSVPSNLSAFIQWLTNSSQLQLRVLTCATKNGELVTVDYGGVIRIWETSQGTLQKSLGEWFRVTGARDEQQLNVEFENSREVTSPKHGKVDPTNAPHVGGNTWAGGTGGRDTAGLGGRGGPYRLDAGHQVFQLPDSEKNAVPPSVQKAAREMAKKAFKDRLKEIEMSEYDARVYERFSGNVKKQVQTLRNILEGLQAKKKERQWLKHQTSGELDDTKLIEGITGEKSIFRKRGEQEPEMGAAQEKPKILRLVVDVSGSMYRFNGHDSRLERQLESVVLLMEAFEGYNEKFQYDIIGHSGDDYHVEFVEFDHPPKNNKERLDVLNKMVAHSQFCMSGDNTLQATKHSIEDISKREADEYFVVVLSDANFDRYGISPKSFGNLLISDDKVCSCAIFIGTLGDQAERIQKQLPQSRAFICLDTINLPMILQKIFTATLLQD